MVCVQRPALLASNEDEDGRRRGGSDEALLVEKLAALEAEHRGLVEFVETKRAEHTAIVEAQQQQASNELASFQAAASQKLAEASAETDQKLTDARCEAAARVAAVEARQLQTSKELELEKDRYRRLAQTASAAAAHGTLVETELALLKAASQKMVEAASEADQKLAEAASAGAARIAASEAALQAASELYTRALAEADQKLKEANRTNAARIAAIKAESSSRLDLQLEKNRQLARTAHESAAHIAQIALEKDILRCERAEASRKTSEKERDLEQQLAAAQGVLEALRAELAFEARCRAELQGVLDALQVSEKAMMCSD